LRGSDATRTIVSDGAGGFRFLDVAPGVYELKVQLQGFRAFERKNIVVGVGRTLAVNVELGIEGLTDSVTVTAPTPMLDARQTGTATNITENELTRIPTSRDPFALMRTVPGVLVDRVNIGGNETGQQSNFVVKGTRPQDAVWTLDGVVVTDMTLAG